MTTEIFLNVNPEFARWCHGPRLAPGAGNVLMGKGPISVTLAPDLVDDPSTRLLVRLSALDELEVLASPEFSDRLAPGLNPTIWSLTETGDNGSALAEWTRKDRQYRVPLNWFNNMDVGQLTTTFPDILGADADVALAMFRALQVHKRFHGGHLFVTRAPGVLFARGADQFPHEIGQCTPEEALVVVGLLLRQRHAFPQDPQPTYRLNASEYNWYCGAAQTVMPRYRDVFRHLVTVDESQANEDSKPLSYLEGTATRCKQLLRTHDRLGLLHLIEAEKGSNNQLSEEQTEAFYNSVQAAVGVLEGLAVLVAELEGHITTERERRTVTFPELRRAERPWVTRLAKYASVVPAITSSWTPLLSLATDERKQGFHYYPVMGVSAKFGELITVTLADGQQEPRFVDQLTIGCIKPVNSPKDVSSLRPGQDGILIFHDQLYLQPWLFTRAMIRDLLSVVDAVLKAIMDADGISLSMSPTEFLSPAGQDLATRMLAWDQRLQG